MVTNRFQGWANSTFEAKKPLLRCANAWQTTTANLKVESSVMKVLFTYQLPFMLAHGGAQIQIQQTQAALEQVGLQVEPLRWWDEKQNGDILHSFARLPAHQVSLAQQKGIKVVVA